MGGTTHRDQMNYPSLNGFEVEKSTRSGPSNGALGRSGLSNSGHRRSKNNSGMPTLKSKARRNYRSPDSMGSDKEVNKFQPKKFKEEDSFAAMQ